MSGVLYRIAWIATDTGATGNGDYCLSFDEAKSYIKSLNDEYKNSILHWIEAKPSASQPLPQQTSSSVASAPLAEEPSHLPQ
jgi:hypothetical protein